MSEPFERPAPQKGDIALAPWLHDKFCEAEDCEGWERASSFGKQGWLDAARETLALLAAPDLPPEAVGRIDVETMSRALVDTTPEADHAE